MHRPQDPGGATKQVGKIITCILVAETVVTCGSNSSSIADGRTDVIYGCPDVSETYGSIADVRMIETGVDVSARDNAPLTFKLSSS
jgi:hypothetical protein